MGLDGKRRLTHKRKRQGICLWIMSDSMSNISQMICVWDYDLAKPVLDVMSESGIYYGNSFGVK